MELLIAIAQSACLNAIIQIIFAQLLNGIAPSQKRWHRFNNQLASVVGDNNYITVMRKGLLHQTESSMCFSVRMPDCRLNRF